MDETDPELLLILLPPLLRCLDYRSVPPPTVGVVSLPYHVHLFIYLFVFIYSLVCDKCHAWHACGGLKTIGRSPSFSPPTMRDLGSNSGRQVGR